MRLAVTKKQLFKISFVFVLLASLVLCIYSVENYKTNVSTTQNTSFNGGINRFPNGTNQRPGGPNFQQQHGMPPNGNMPFQRENMQKGAAGTAYKFTPLLTAYSVGFLIVFIASYCFFIHKKNKISLNNEKLLIFSLLGIDLFLRISSSTLMEGHMDINLFKNWATVYVNIYSVLFGEFQGMNSTYFSPVIMITSLLNVLLFAYLVKVILDIAVRKRIYTNLSSENMNF